ncbi:unnamed protein product [Sphagnum balticum]
MRMSTTRMRPHRKGIFAVSEREKWTQWMAMSNVPAEQCANEYIRKVEEVKIGYTRGTRVSARAGFGVGVSRMMEISDAEAESSTSPVTQESDWFKAIKDGSCDRVRRLLAEVADSEECLYLR